MEKQLALETTGLTKVYGHGHTEVVALRDASMRVRNGEIVALLGPSGAGKSTFLLCVGLIHPPTHGRVSIGGTLMQDGSLTLGDLRRFRRERIGFVFQKSNLIPFLNALENVQLVCELIGRPPPVARRRAMELLDALGVAKRATNMPTELSGGEQQRVTVARALANEPSLILADEPTAALDSIRGRQVMELFRDVAHLHGAGVIVVTHDHRALDVFDTTYEMEDGMLSAPPSVPIMMRHFPTLQTLWANRSLNHGRKPEESTQSSLARTSHDPTTFQPQREVAHRRSRGPLHQAW